MTNPQQLAERLEIKADCIQMGEKIAWGSDSAIMREAADIIRRQQDLMAEYIIWRDNNPHIKGGENYVKRFRQSIATSLFQEK